MSYGLTTAGFLKKPQEQILSELQAELAAEIGAVNIASGPTHQLIGILSASIAECWEQLESIAAQSSRSSATGSLLDAVGAMTGTPRRAASKSSAVLTLTLSAPTTVPAGSVVSRAGVSTTRFVTLEAVTVAAAGTYVVDAECEITGPVLAPAGSLTVIESPVSGWASVTNALDAESGADIETDAAYRVRQVAELEASGAGTIDTIRARVLRVAGVRDALARENRTNGVALLPPYSFEVIVWDGPDLDATNDSVAQAIWDTQPATARAVGTSSGTATDATGIARTVPFSRVAQLEIYIELDLAGTATWTGGDTAAVQAAIASWGDANLGVGDDVVRSRLYCVIHAASAKIENVLSIRVGLAALAVYEADLAVNEMLIASLDTSRIAVAYEVL